MLFQKKLFTEEECHKIRNYATNMEDRVITTYYPSINGGEIDTLGGHNIAQHIAWSSSNEYDWMFNRILEWLKYLDLPIENLGWEFILQRYPVGFEFKPHIDDVLGSNKQIIRKRHYTILVQLATQSEYSGGELWVQSEYDTKISQQIGNVSVFGTEQLHWVTKITEGERWSCTIFLEKDSLKKTLM